MTPETAVQDEQDILLDMTEIDAPDEGYFDPYERAAGEGGGGFTLPAPGAYKVQMPEIIATQVRATKGQPPKRYIEALFGTEGREGQGITIVDGPHAGFVIRYVRPNNLQPTSFAPDETGKRVPSGKEPGSDLLDILRNFGYEGNPASRQEWDDALQNIAGKIAPQPFYFTWKGTAKGNKNVRGYAITLWGKKGFPVAGQSYVEMVADTPFTRKVRGVDTTVAAGEKYRVYANLVLGRRGASPRKA